MTTAVVSPQIPIMSLQGLGLNAGFVYIGVAGEDPQTNPQAVYWDEALTIPATQPLETLGGYITYLGSPHDAYTNGSYSMGVYAKDETLVWQRLVVTPAASTGEDVDIVLNWTGAQTTADAWLGGEKVTRPMTFPADFAGSEGQVVTTNPAATYTVTLKKNGTNIGTATASTGGVWTFATSGGTSFSLAVGDTFNAYGSGDTTIQDFTLTFKGSVST